MKKLENYKPGDFFEKKCAKMTPEEAVRLMEEKADKHFLQKRTVEFDEKELRIKYQELGEAQFEVDEILARKKLEMEEFKLELKEPKARVKELHEQIENNGEEKEAYVAEFYDHMNGKVLLFDDQMRFIKRRDMLPSEQQSTIPGAEREGEGEEAPEEENVA